MISCFQSDGGAGNAYCRRQAADMLVVDGPATAGAMIGLEW
jgi:hypothetical protein